MPPKKKKTAAVLTVQTDPRAPLDGAAFLAAAQRTVAMLRDDLLKRADSSPGVAAALRAQWHAEREAKRTGDEWEIWRRRVVVQIAAAWVLSLVFARTLEDRGLVERNRIAGPGAIDSQDQFRAIAPYLTDRDYLLTVFRELANLPAAGDLFDPAHNPVWKLGPSIEGARALLDLFRSPDSETPSFRFGQADTRFLGDLYQNLDEETRERFALLQTPHFIETYILDRTLERAIERFGLDDTTLIDPTCGSGHFLLGAFERLVDHRLRKEPGLDVRAAARRAIDSVYGADINPYAIAIARFRLTLAFLDKAGYARLEEAPALPLHVVVGDSLLHAPSQSHLGDVVGTSKEAWAGKEFALEDESAAKGVLFRRYAAVVGNPPYITVKDPVLRERYREMYPLSAAGKYSLGAPFTERFFLLARPTGFVGMITANSFMKREFGKKLIEQFLPKVNLDGVVNTSGTYIPGHGTPTVLLFGSNEPKQGSAILTVLAKRGEPSTPEDSEQGLVWRSIADHGSEVGFDDDYISVARVDRSTLGKHPWSLGGGGAAELKDLLDERKQCLLRDVVEDVGPASFTGLDDAFFMPRHAGERLGLGPVLRPMVTGENVRDWAIGEHEAAVTPYDVSSHRPIPYDPTHAWGRFLWAYRAGLERVVGFGGKTRKECGESWWQWYRWQTDRYLMPLRISFASIATHNHFVLERGGHAFNRHAPIVKLKSGAKEDDYLTLLAYLNSSTACFWMKQVFFPKTSGTNVGDVRGQEHRIAYEFAGTGLMSLPLPPGTNQLLSLARRLDALASSRARRSPGSILQTSFGSARELEATLCRAEEDDNVARREMVGLQEDLDWCVYALFELTPSATTPSSPAIEPVERPFLATSIGNFAAADARGTLLRIPGPLNLIETPLHKRPWFGFQGVFHRDGWTYLERAVEEAEALLADRLESAVRGVLEIRSSSWITTAALAFRGLPAIRDFFAARSSTAEASVLGDVIASNSVPYLAAYRYTDTGLEKRREWERVWSLQRAEDRGETSPSFDPPPKYDQKDYRDATFWRLRGRLDVPKERFISYPGCESDEDKEPVYGWAGWNHLQQAIALATLYMKRKQGEAWGKERLAPMLAGLEELLPWIWQWHAEPTAESGGMKPGQYIADFLSAQCQELAVTVDDLRAWRPVSARRSRAVAPEEPLLHRPAFSAAEESVLLLLALVHSRPASRLTLARAFELLHQPTLLKRSVPPHLKARATAWAKEVKGRKRAPGVFRASLEHLFGRGLLEERGSPATIGLTDTAVQAPTEWWLREAELGLAAADGMTDEIAAVLMSKIPNADRDELRAAA